MHPTTLFPSSLALLPLAAFAFAFSDPYPGYEYGNDFYLGPPSGDQYIVKATYSLLPPAPPTDYVKTEPENRWLSLWIGIQEDSDNVNAENFVQPLLNWGPNNEDWYVSLFGFGVEVQAWMERVSVYADDLGFF